MVTDERFQTEYAAALKAIEAHRKRADRTTEQAQADLDFSFDVALHHVTTWFEAASARADAAIARVGDGASDELCERILDAAARTEALYMAKANLNGEHADDDPKRIAFSRLYLIHWPNIGLDLFPRESKPAQKGA